MAHRHPKVRYFTVPLLFFMALVIFTLAISASPQMSSASATVAQPGVPNADGTEPLPPGTSIETLLTNMEYPVALAFDPAGRLFYTEKRTNANANIGRVRLFENGVLNPTPVISFNVTASGEQGLLGIAIDPNFNSNHYIYVFYTCACTPLENRVVRFVENNGIGSNEQIIFTSPNSTNASNHNGGNIHFAPDGKLYITLGDDGDNPSHSQNVTVKQGKIHRINPDGTFPNDNPVFTQTGALPSLYAMGLRNSFDFAYDPLTPPNPYYRIFASENGPSCDDEMNRIEAGWNYGWRSSYPCDDANPSPTYNTIPPMWFLGNGGGGPCCIAPTGVAVYTGTQIPQWTGHLFMAGYNNQSLRHFYLNGDRTLATTVNVVTGVSAGMDIETGPDGAFWYIQGGGYAPGTLRRIVGPGSTSTPTIAPSNTPNPPTSTPPPPTSTATRTSVSTITPSVGPSITPGINTPTNTAVSTSTSTNTVMPTQTPVATNTMQPTNTIIPTRTPAPTNTTAPPTATASAVPTCTVSFSDVPSRHTFYASITCLACRGIVSGYADGTFRPDNLVTRGQLAKIVSNAAGFTEPPGAQIFQDVAPNHTFYEWINRLTNRGYMSGYSCGNPGEPCVNNRPYFRPFNNATRAQTSKIVANAARFTGTPTGQIFQDVPPTHPFYEWIQNLAARGIIGGYMCGEPGEPCVPPGNRAYFRPYNDVTRGQSAKIVANTFYPGCGSMSEVVIVTFASNPEHLTVGAGATVRWRNLDLDYHSVTSRATPPLFDSDRLDQNQVYDVTFDEPGTYEYYCKFHIYHGGTITVTGP